MVQINAPEAIYRTIDKIIVPFIYLIVPKKTIANRLEKERAYWKEEPLKYFSIILGTLHDRASSMVSHLSLMLGICLFLLQADQLDSQSFIEKLIIMIDAVVYLILVLLSVRCLRSIGLDRDYESPESYMEHIRVEIALKYAVMQVVNSFTIAATVILVIALIFGINA